MFRAWVVCHDADRFKFYGFHAPPLINVEILSASAWSNWLGYSRNRQRPCCIVVVGFPGAGWTFDPTATLGNDLRKVVYHVESLTHETLLNIVRTAAAAEMTPTKAAPKISVFTSFHRTPPAVIARTAASLARQTFDDYEWVVCHDDWTETDIGWQSQVPPALANKIRSIGWFKSGRIGWLKGMLCAAARGRYLVELDHDDELAPHALQRINDAMDDTRADFVYSRFAEVLPDGRSNEYGADYWEYDTFETDWSDAGKRTFRAGRLHDFHGTFRFNGTTNPPSTIWGFAQTTCARFGGIRTSNLAGTPICRGAMTTTYYADFG